MASKHSTMRRCRDSPKDVCIKYLDSHDRRFTADDLCEVRYIDSFKGQGVFAKVDIPASTFLFEYEGEVISVEEGNRRLVTDGRGPGFIFFLLDAKKCVDASKSTGMGRLVNDSVVQRKANCVVKEVIYNGTVHACLFAAGCNIKAGTELCYFYGPTDDFMYWRRNKEKPEFFRKQEPINTGLLNPIKSSTARTEGRMEHCMGLVLASPGEVTLSAADTIAAVEFVQGRSVEADLNCGKSVCVSERTVLNISNEDQVSTISNYFGDLELVTVSAATAAETAALLESSSFEDGGMCVGGSDVLSIPNKNQLLDGCQLHEEVHRIKIHKVDCASIIVSVVSGCNQDQCDNPDRFSFFLKESSSNAEFVKYRPDELPFTIKQLTPETWYIVRATIGKSRVTEPVTFQTSAKDGPETPPRRKCESVILPCADSPQHSLNSTTTSESGSSRSLFSTNKLNVLCAGEGDKRRVEDKGNDIILGLSTDLNKPSCQYLSVKPPPCSSFGRRHNRSELSSGNDTAKRRTRQESCDELKDADWEPSSGYSDDSSSDTDDAEGNYQQRNDTEREDSNTGSRRKLVHQVKSEVAVGSVPKKVYSKRQRKVCPVKRCMKTVYALPRHLRLCHGWSMEQSRAAIFKYSLRKPCCNKKRTSSTSDYHRRRPCPVASCPSIIQRLAPHLRSVHGVTDERQMRMWLQMARQRRRLEKMAECNDTSEDEVGPTVDQLSNEISVLSADEAELIDEISLCDTESRNSETEQPDFGSPTNHISRRETGSQNSGSEPPVVGTSANQIDTLKNPIRDFGNWLSSVDGGCKAARSVKQHMKQIGAILSAVDNEHKMPSALLDKQRVRQKFLDSYVRDKEFLPGTVKSYLTTLVHWYAYVLTEPQNSKLSPGEINKAKQMQDATRRWTASIRSQSNKRHLQKQDTDLDCLPTSDNVSAFESSSVSLEAIKLLSIMSSKKESLTQSEFVLIRNYLLARIALSNACRSGVLANMVAVDVQKAKKVDDQYVITVQEHKTASTHGPAKIVVDRCMYYWLSTFVTYTACLSEDDVDERPAFPSWTGAALTSGQISQCMQVIWSKAGVANKINCTLVRKAAVTNIHRQCPEAKSDLSTLMLHKESTAETYYKLANREKSAVKAKLALSNIMQKNKKVENASFPADGAPLSSKEATTNRDSIAVNDKSAGSLKAGWSVAAVRQLRTAFAEELAGRTINMKNVAAKLFSLPPNELDGMSARQVYDRLRHELTLCPAVESNLPECTETSEDRVKRLLDSAPDPDSDTIPDTADELSTAPSLKGKFSVDEVKIIRKLCASVIAAGVINSTNIKKALSVSDEGKRLVHSFDIDVIINRVNW